MWCWGLWGDVSGVDVTVGGIRCGGVNARLHCRGMASGGQRGLSLTGEPMVAVAILVSVIWFQTGWVSCEDLLPEDDPTPVEAQQDECEQAWADDQADRADDTDAALLATSFCQDHNRAAVAAVRNGDQKQMELDTPDTTGPPQVAGPEVVAVVEEDGSLRPVP